MDPDQNLGPNTDLDPGDYLKFTEFFNIAEIAEFSNLLSDFFCLKLDEPFRNQEIF